MTIEENIARITDSTLTPTDLWPRVCGSTASRESRMEVVAWVAVCKFNCNLEGGFVRDWIVANERVRPPLTIQPSEWVQFDAITGIPSLLKALVPSDIDYLYKNVELAMQKIIGSTIISVQQIYNLELENIWKSMKVLIANECSDSSPNEQFLFHGTHTNKWKRIMEEGFDYGFFKTLGVFGNGAYFADNAQKSHEYTLPMPSDPTMTRIILFSKVALGQEMIMKHMNSALYAAPRDHHSVHGIASDSSEYVIYRLTQALPFLIITYQVHSS
ncbi:unnamed protein product [Rotaria magnacalcarata]|uniref:Poly [ADP-ribose] polymerase n=1 Tax=Rotaria magnacalcarata TaxID=392030 RepID=A0A8S2Q2M6_9BILA|nr:unnamed protein product [Rotaria magnacalcarata]